VKHRTHAFLLAVLQKRHARVVLASPLERVVTTWHDVAVIDGADPPTRQVMLALPLTEHWTQAFL